jgi:hypothetical protein
MQYNFYIIIIIFCICSLDFFPGSTFFLVYLFLFYLIWFDISHTFEGLNRVLANVLNKICWQDNTTKFLLISKSFLKGLKYASNLGFKLVKLHIDSQAVMKIIQEDGTVSSFNWSLVRWIRTKLIFHHTNVEFAFYVFVTLILCSCDRE